METNLDKWERGETIPDDGWVEWPSFPEHEAQFDWSLSLREMGSGSGLTLGNNLSRIKKPYKSTKRRKSNVTPVEKNREDAIKKAHYINYLGKDCPCVGFTSKPLGHGIKQYQNAYYHSGEEKYIFNGDVGIVAFYKTSISNFIKPFFPDAKDVELSVNTNTAKVVKMEKSLDEIVSKMLSEPQENFHF